MTHLELDHDLAAAVAREGGARAAGALTAAVDRAELMLAYLLEACGCTEPAVGAIRFVASGGPGAGASVDPTQLATLSAPRLSSILLAAALDQVIAAVDAAPAGPPPPKRRRLSRRDQDNNVLGVEWTMADESELIIYYRPHHGFLRARQGAALDETAEVEERIEAAMTGIAGAAIVDKSGWQWQVRIP